MGVSAVAGVGVRNDERAVVDQGRGLALLFGHAGAGKMLVPIGGEQHAHQRGRFVGHLTQRVARQVGPRVFGHGPLGRGGPASQVDRLDAKSLEGHRLARRIRAEGGDLPSLGEQLSQPGVKAFGRGPGNGVIGRDRAPLLGHVPSRMQSHDPLEARAIMPFLDLRDLMLERFHQGTLPFLGGAGPTKSRFSVMRLPSLAKPSR